MRRRVSRGRWVWRGARFNARGWWNDHSGDHPVVAGERGAGQFMRWVFGQRMGAKGDDPAYGAPTRAWIQAFSTAPITVGVPV